MSGVGSKTEATQISCPLVYGLSLRDPGQGLRLMAGELLECQRRVQRLLNPMTFERFEPLQRNEHRNDMAEKSAVNAADTLIDTCLMTNKSCLQAVQYIAEAGGQPSLSGVLNGLLDCAEASATAASFAARSSSFSRETLRWSAGVAARCAEQLAPHEHQNAPLRSAYALCLELAAVGRSSDSDATDVEDMRDKALADTFPASDPPPV